MSNFLVLGGTGKTGRRLVETLAAAGHTVRAAARNPGPASDRVVPVRFDWGDPSTHDAALAGVDGVYVVPPELDLDHPRLVAALAGRARRAGVRRAVLLSVRGADADESGPFRQAELAVERSGLEWTVLRPTWFAQNFTEGLFRPGDALVAPAGDGRVPFIDVQDIAEAAAAALTGDGHHGSAYELSGPRAVSFAELAALLAEHTGRPIGYVDADPATWGRDAVTAGLPPEYAELLSTLLALVRAGHEAAVSDGFELALGRPATSIESWAAREAHVLRDPVTA